MFLHVGALLLPKSFLTRAKSLIISKNLKISQQQFHQFILLITACRQLKVRCFRARFREEESVCRLTWGFGCKQLQGWETPAFTGLPKALVSSGRSQESGCAQHTHSDVQRNPKEGKVRSLETINGMTEISQQKSEIYSGIISASFLGTK